MYINILLENFNIYIWSFLFDEQWILRSCLLSIQQNWTIARWKALFWVVLFKHNTHRVESFIVFIVIGASNDKAYFSLLAKTKLEALSVQRKCPCNHQYFYSMNQSQIVLKSWIFQFLNQMQSQLFRKNDRVLHLRTC